MTDIKKITALGVMAAMVIGCTACGSKEEVPAQPEESAAEESVETAAQETPAASEEVQEVQTENEGEESAEGEFLPKFYYNQVLADNGFQPLEAAAYDYLAFDHVKGSDADHVLIPYVNIVDVDETDPSDVLLYGDYYVWEFEKQQDTLVMVSGGHCPGVIHLERTGEGETAIYSPKGTMDEGFTDDDTKAIFGEYYDHYLTLSSDDAARDSGLALNIADYVTVNNLDITGYQMSPDETKDLPAARAKHITGALPEYSYPGPELFYSVLYDYLKENLLGSRNEKETVIPCPVIVYTDESNNDDIRVYGNFWIYSYYLDGDIMKTSSGGSYPGCIHIKSTDAGYEVTDMEIVEDGQNYTDSAKKIFGEHYEDFVKATGDTAGTEEIRAQIIANYVAANDLSVTAYQDYGWDPVALPEENIDTFYSDL